MRRPCNRDIYARAPLRGLQDAQSRIVLPELQRCVGSHGLLVASSGGDAPPALPLLACWIQLHVNGARYGGDLVGATDEGLPFSDDAFDVVWLRHALEVLPLSAHVLAEAIRVLAPAGMLVIAGLHPLGGWAPWFYWRTRGTTHQLHTPLGLMHTLRRAGVDIVSVRRVGAPWPMTGHGDGAGSALWGGGYVLLARKQRRLITPLRLRAMPLRASGNHRLAPSQDARRGSTT